MEEKMKTYIRVVVDVEVELRNMGVKGWRIRA
jgi:hypothetical protein